MELVLKTIKEYICDTIKHIFNSCLEKEIWPEALKVADIKQLDGAIGEATGTFRSIRKLNTTED